MRIVSLVRSIALVLLAALLLPGLYGQAVGAEYRVLSTDELKALIDAGADLVLIDTRTSEEYQEAHIKGALSIPESTFDVQLSLLPPDRNALIVLYCNGVKCGKSRKAAKKADAAGYRNLSIYAEGFPVWEEKGMAIVAGPEYGQKIETTKMRPGEIKELLDAQSRDLVVVDVRDESEFREGHIPGALNIPVETFSARSEVLPKEKKVVVYCNTGGRSYNAYRKLIKLAYPNIAQATFAEWMEAGMPVEK